MLHDAYEHFEQRYGLAHQAAVSISPDRKPGARRMLEIQRLLASGEIGCVFKEPQYRQAVLGKVLEQADVSLGLLDPLAVEAEGYEQFIRGFSAEFYRCIAPSALN